jgi:hypothetical protein
MKAWFLRIGLGFFLALLLLYIFVLVRSLIPATVHDQELQLPRADIPEGANAFDVLQTATSHVWWPKAKSEQIDDLTRGTNWDDALASMVVASNRETLAGWDAAAKLPDFQVPPATNFYADLTYLSSWKKLAQIAAVREIFLLHNGQDKEAFDKIMDHVRLGQQMQNAHGPLIDYLVGIALENIDLSQMQHWVGRTHLTPNQLKDYIRQLGVCSDGQGIAFANTVKAEYQWEVGSLGFMLGANYRGETDYPRSIRFLPVFNSSQTKALLAKGAFTLLNAAPLHYNELKIVEMNARPSLASMYLSGNAVGQIMYYMERPAATACLAKKSQADVWLEATRTILALRAYQLTHGNLPPDLSALVPEFLDEVPVDDFDGQPLRYSSERKIVYSVGQNLKDDGGDDTRSGPNDSHLDLVYKFDF